MRNFGTIIILILLLIFALGSTVADNKEKFVVLERIYQDTETNIQGFDYDDGYLYQSVAGRPGSALLKMTPSARDTLIIKSLPGRYYVEGVALFGDRIAHMTVESYWCFIYDKYSFITLDSFIIPSVAGYGLTFDGEYLIMSDGTADLIYLDTATFKEVKRIKAVAPGRSYLQLGEIEYYKGNILAVPLRTKEIAMIDPESSEVVKWYDLRELYVSPMDGYINGLAWDSTSKSFYVSGPMWPHAYRISLPE